MDPILREFESQLCEEPRKRVPDFGPGDTLSVRIKIKEGDKERIQEFQGSVIQRRNGNTAGETFTLRKVSGGIGVFRTFHLMSPLLEKIVVLRRGRVRRARLFYLKGRMGKSARVKGRL